MLSRRIFLKALLGTALAGLMTGAYATIIEPGWRLRVQNWAVQPAAWPRGQKLRIVVVADIHAGVPSMSESRVQDIVDLANAQGGDLIALLGDYRASHIFQTRQVPIEQIAPILAGLQAPLGVHAVLGNHDWWQDTEAMARRAGPIHHQTVLEGVGIPVLANRAVKLGHGPAAFWLMGLDSQSTFHQTHPRDPIGMSDIRRSMVQITDDAPVILLAHEPDQFMLTPDRIALTLSGHTHGGQIRFGSWVPIVPSLYGKRLAYGHIRRNGRDLVVSGGLGCSGMPVRFGMPPEITVVDLS